MYMYMYFYTAAQSHGTCPLPYIYSPKCICIHTLNMYIRHYLINMPINKLYMFVHPTTGHNIHSHVHIYIVHVHVHTCTCKCTCTHVQESSSHKAAVGSSNHETRNEETAGDTSSIRPTGKHKVHEEHYPQCRKSECSWGTWYRCVQSCTMYMHVYIYSTCTCTYNATTCIHVQVRKKKYMYNVHVHV